MLTCARIFVQEDETISPRRQKDLHAFSDTLTIICIQIDFSACSVFLYKMINYLQHEKHEIILA